MKINYVFINNFSIILTSNLQMKNHPCFFRLEEVDLLEVIDKMFKGEVKELYLYHENLKKLRSDFVRHFTCIKAAGGKVVNATGEVLFIYRNDVWDLPKGKIEKGEKKKEAALREVQEETGVVGLELGRRLETTYHLYRYKQKTILKISYWYEMFTTSKAPLHPQLEEGISRVEWLNKSQISKVLPHSYANIRRLFLANV
ncbi:NUDIX domain-containing protein [Flavobacteriaceae bacterium F08102]|nr:NUDIX domain-containing protein [Flavobacteriaceae bacterium F08102]